MPQTDDNVLTKPKLAKPKLYAVVLHNDDFTPMDFVVLILERFFHKSGDEAHHLMMKVHVEGKAAVGVYTYEVAETKVDQCMTLAAKFQHPLMVTAEEA